MGKKKMPLDWVHYCAIAAVIGEAIYIVALIRRRKREREMLYSGLKQLLERVEPLGNEQLLTSISSMMIHFEA
jgi:hypothetical protein